jgi:uncharacterized membrane protein
MSIGPLQLVVLGFDEAAMPAEVLDQLRDLRQKGIVRLVDGVFAVKNGDGDIQVVEVTDLDSDEVLLLGTLARSLFGYGVTGLVPALIGMESGVLAGEVGDFGLTEDQLYEVADLIPGNSAAMFLLIEHQWALGLKQGVLDAGGVVLANGWITPATLIAMGQAAAAGPLD